MAFFYNPRNYQSYMWTDVGALNVNETSEEGHLK